jgi:hypothetical protein
MTIPMTRLYSSGRRSEHSVYKDITDETDVISREKVRTANLRVALAAIDRYRLSSNREYERGRFCRERP